MLLARTLYRSTHKAEKELSAWLLVAVFMPADLLKLRFQDFLRQFAKAAHVPNTILVFAAVVDCSPCGSCHADVRSYVLEPTR